MIQKKSLKEIRRKAQAVLGLARVYLRVPFLVNSIRKYSFQDLGQILISEVEINQLKKLFTIHGSDKSIFHDYDLVYENILNQIECNHLLEFGIGSQDLSIPNHMQKEFLPGGSLNSWAERLPHAQIVGADIDPKILCRTNQIGTILLDQRSTTSIKTALDPLNHCFDLIVVDGLHTVQANFNSFCVAIHKLSENGILVVEDVSEREMTFFWKPLISLLPKRLKGFILSRKNGYLVIWARRII